MWSKVGASKPPSARQWRAFLESRGVEPQITKQYLDYIRPLARRELPVVFDREHLAKLLGRTEAFVAAAAFSASSFYRRFDIPKRSGGSRAIAAPYESLKECQRWIVENILTRVKSHDAAMAYQIGRSIRTNAEAHARGGSYILGVDIENFFPSIRLPRVIDVFLRCGYSQDVALVLAKLCCLDDALPQGAPSSPALSNVICRRLDGRLSGLAKRVEAAYTRYADDMTFSGGEEIGSRWFLHAVRRILNDCGFALNEEKTRLFTPAMSSQIVTGLNVAEGEIRLPKAFKRALRQELHFMARFGVLSHLGKRKIRDPNHLERLAGRLAFWAFVEPDNDEPRALQGALRRMGQAAN